MDCGRRAFVGAPSAAIRCAGKEYEMEEPLLSCSGLVLGYGSRRVAEDIAFAIRPGEGLCVVGENGTGKSTLLRTLLGLQPALAGKVDRSPDLNPGDIGALSKLSNTQTGDTLSTKANAVIFERPVYSTPYTYQKVETKNKGDEDKFAQAMAKLLAEDKTMKIVQDKENRQTLIYGIGDQQIDVTVSKLASRYKVEVEVGKPRVPYRETIRKMVEKQGKHKKQSGGHGQYGDVHIRFQPSGDMEKAYVFDEEVVGGAVPKNFFPAVEKGIAESVLAGPLAGYPVVGLRATLFFGSYHPVDSSEQAFKMAAKLAVKAAFTDPKENCSPCLLEPIASLKVTVPDKFTGDIMGDLNKRRGRVLGMNPISGGKQEIVADVPLAELYGYSTDLRSMTGGIGDFEYNIDRYEQTPSDVQSKVIEEAAKYRQEEEDE